MIGPEVVDKGLHPYIGDFGEPRIKAVNPGGTLSVIGHVFVADQHLQPYRNPCNQFADFLCTNQRQQHR